MEFWKMTTLDDCPGGIHRRDISGTCYFRNSKVYFEISKNLVFEGSSECLKYILDNDSQFADKCTEELLLAVFEKYQPPAKFYEKLLNYRSDRGFVTGWNSALNHISEHSLSIKDFRDV